MDTVDNEKEIDIKVSDHDILNSTSLIADKSSLATEDMEGGDIEISYEIDKPIIYPAEVRIEKAQYSILHLQILLKKRQELVLNPDFQRHNVWKFKQKSELVESILMGIPIPLVYLFEDQYGKKQVVDGKQRITAILDFLENEYRLSGLNILEHLNGKLFSELEPKLQGIFEDYQLYCYIIQPPTPERIKYDIFDRVNRGGTSINKQEMRNALYGGKCTKLLKEISNSTEFLNATGYSISSERMKDHYAILRALGFMMLKKGVFIDMKDLEYRGDIDTFLAKFMVYINNDASDEQIEENKKIFLKAMLNSYFVLGEDGFRFNGGVVRRPINMPLMEAIIFLFSHNIKLINLSHVKSIIEKLKKDFDSSKYFKGNVDSTTSLDYRFGEVKKAINEINNQL